MNKQLTNNSQRSFLSKRRIIMFALILIGLYVLVVLTVLVTNLLGINDPTRAAYGEINIPSAWKQTSSQSINGFHCILSDVPCPNRNLTYSMPNGSAANNGVVQIKSNLIDSGYTIDGTCFRNACEGYMVEAHKSNVVVRASAGESGNSHVVYLTIEDK